MKQSLYPPTTATLRSLRNPTHAFSPLLDTHVQRTAREKNTQHSVTSLHSRLLKTVEVVQASSVRSLNVDDERQQLCFTEFLSRMQVFAPAVYAV